MRPRILTFTLLATLGACGGGSPQSQVYDVVILDGGVMDPETNLDATANVGIKDGRIAVITTDRISGDETIDARHSPRTLQVGGEQPPLRDADLIGVHTRGNEA